MLALYRCVNPVTKFKKLTGLTQVIRFGLNVPPSQWKTPRRFLQAGITGMIQAASTLGTMANKGGKISLSGSRCLSSKASTQDGKTRVKRVSIEGNIGKIRNIFSLYI